MDDSIPIVHEPPSMIRSFSVKKFPNSSTTAIAVVGETALNLFALGAAIP